MQLTEQQRRRFIELLLQTYKSFKHLCDANGIRFFAAGGTMIGAVRHGGMIPWDDDIDVYMFREDYEKFLSLKASVSDSDYEIIDPLDNGYYCAMAKYSHRSSTLWEMREIPFLLGIYIDVFVLDFEEGSKEEVERRRMKYVQTVDLFRLSAIRRSWREIGSSLLQLQIGQSFWYLFQKCVLRPLRPWFYRRVQWWPGKIKGEWMVAYTGTSLQKDVFRTEWFEGPTKEYPFEDTTIPVPQGYDAFLRHMYGNYMSLPPIEQQVSHHPHFYLNMERRITEAEAKALIR